MPLKGFVPPVSGSKVEPGTMGPKAYDLLIKAKYDPEEGKTLGELPQKVTGDKVHCLNKTQKMLQQKGYAIRSPSTGLGYVPKSPLQVLIKQMKNCHTSVVEESSTEGQKENKLKAGRGHAEQGTFPAQQACRSPHPWEVIKERFISTFLCISVRQDRETGHLVYEFSNIRSRHEYSLKKIEESEIQRYVH
ncbi:hypothetical protein LIER_29810 [Lithospermum erythrorhizon]|uniref:Uncharacterized protein n=1 Tax=Lithospermum erythrorhizon TaxID=34254 RepID=A0AAV3RPF2_LITER